MMDMDAKINCASTATDAVQPGNHHEDEFGHLSFRLDSIKFLNEISMIKSRKPEPQKALPGIKKVISHSPATIVFWEDGTKTIVKCGERDVFDPEKGLAMAISKKALGNQGNYYNVFRKWVKVETSISYELVKLYSTLQSAFIQGFADVEAFAGAMRELFVEREESV